MRGIASKDVFLSPFLRTMQPWHKSLSNWKFVEMEMGLIFSICRMWVPAGTFLPLPEAPLELPGAGVLFLPLEETYPLQDRFYL